MMVEPLSRSTPEAQGISASALLAFVDAAAQQGLELHSMMLLRHGVVVGEGWWSPYASQHPHMLYSLSKSFASTAAGLAIADGLLSLDDTVISFFPDDVPPTVSENLAAMKLRHLLSMSAGHAEDTTGALHEEKDGNWVRAFLARPVAHEPGTHFVYNSGATYIVSAIVQKVTGKTLVEWLGPRLFEPLGIANPVWEMDTQGIVNTGGWGLNITTEDIARFGQLYLQKGVWKGKRLLPESWVEEATGFQVSNGDRPDSDWSEGYGYQFWRCRHGAYRGDGAFGQFCVVMPEQDAVLAITANVGEMQIPLNLVWEHLLPAMKDAPLPDNPALQEQLRERLSHLTIAPPEGETTSPTAAQVSRQTYRFAPNEQRLESITFDFADTETILTLHDAKGTHKVRIGGNGAWEKSDTTFLGGRLRRGSLPGNAGIIDRVATSGAWTDENTFTARLCFYDTPFTPTIICRFDGNDRVHFELQGRVGFGPSERPAVEGHRK